MKSTLPVSLVSCLLLLASLPTHAIIDTNENGISDLWEKQFNSSNLFPISFDPLADSDGDGWTNAQEAAAGTDPFDGNSPTGIVRPVITHIPAVHTAGVNGIAEILTPEAVTVSWPTLVGKQYTLLFSPDLTEESWFPIDGSFIGNCNEITYHFEMGQSDKCFWRVQVEDVDTDGDGLTDTEENELGTSSFFADTNDDGIDDASALAMGLNPAGDTADTDGDGVPDNHYYTVEFQFEYESHAVSIPKPFLYTDREDLNARYFTRDWSFDYSVTDSPRYETLTNGNYLHKLTSLEGGVLKMDGTQITSETGIQLFPWLAQHGTALGEGEYIEMQATQTNVSLPTTTETNEFFKTATTTTSSTDWVVKHNVTPGSQTDPILRSGTEVIVNTQSLKRYDLISFPEIWEDYIKLTPRETSVVRMGPAGENGKLIGSVGESGAASIVSSWFKKSNYPYRATISSPMVYWGGDSWDTRLKAVRWRWVRFDPLKPFETNYTAPPASYMKTFRLPVTQSDRLGQNHSGDIENTMVAKNIVEIECLGSQGGTDWQNVSMDRFASFKVDDPVHLEDIGFSGKLGDTKVSIQNLSSEVVSRDRMIAGRITIPTGLEDGFQIQFVNTTTGEDLGTYSNLLSHQYGPRFESSDSRLFDEWERQSYEAGTLDPRIRTQKVIFCGNRIERSPIEFYTVFASVGEVEIRMIHDGNQVGVLRQTLSVDAAFGRVIDYVNKLVGDPLASTATTVASVPAPVAGVANQIRPLAKRALVPFFNGFGAWMAAQTDVDALVIGLLEGIKQGAADDAKLVQWVHTQTIVLQYGLPAMFLVQVQRWTEDPYTRALETANAIRNAVQHGLIEPMQGLGGQLGEFAGNFSSWERFKEFNWKVHFGLMQGQVVAVQIIADSAGVILQGLGDWYVEFCGRMYEGAELGVFQSVPMGDLSWWRQDLRSFYYTFGYSFGYLGEQLLLGHGVSALAKGLSKAGPIVSLTSLPKVKSLGVRLLPFFDKRWAARVITTADHEAAEQAIRAAQTTRSDAHAVLNTDSAKPVADWLDEAIARQAGSVNGKLIAEEIGNSPKILQSLRNGTSIFLDRLAMMEKLLGSKLDDVVARNFTKLYEKKLLADPSTGADIFEDMLVAVHTQYLSGQRPILDQLAANAASLDRLEVFFKGPPPFSPWKAGFETADSFGDSSRGLLIQLHEAVHGKYQGWTNLDILKDGKVVRATGVDLVNATDPGHFVQITTTAASAPNWVTKLASSAEAVQQRGGNKLTFEVFWLENNGRPATSLQALENAKAAIQADTGITIEIFDTASKFDHWAF